MDEFFNGYCSACGQRKDMCTDDPTTDLDNPGFICLDCLERRSQSDRGVYVLHLENVKTSEQLDNGVIIRMG